MQSSVGAPSPPGAPLAAWGIMGRQDATWVPGAKAEAEREANATLKPMSETEKRMHAERMQAQAGFEIYRKQREAQLKRARLLADGMM